MICGVFCAETSCLFMNLGTPETYITYCEKGHNGSPNDLSKIFANCIHVSNKVIDRKIF